jgi:hypothetical protein
MERKPTSIRADFQADQVQGSLPSILAQLRWASVDLAAAPNEHPLSKKYLL